MATQTATRTHPQDVLAEASVLGAILLRPQAIAEIDDLVDVVDFFDPRHRHIYEAALKIYRAGQDVDILTIGTALKAEKQFTKIGGNAYLDQLINTVPTAAHIKTYAEIVINKARRRGLLTAADDFRKLAFDEKKALNQIIEEAEIKLFNISQQQVRQDVLRLEAILKQSFAELDILRANQDKLRGLSTGFVNLDSRLAGFQKSDLIIIAGRPAMGKTGFALNLAYNVAYNKAVAQQKTALYFSLEMSKDQLVDRLLSMHTGIDNWKVRTGQLKDADFKKLKEGGRHLEQADLYIDDTPGLNISEIRTKIRRLNYKQTIDLVIVDYLQLMQGMKAHGDNRVTEIAEISRGLKLIAKELNIPIIALSQLSRQTENRESKKPALVDLRESGAIEQDADVVIFLYREEYYQKESDKKGILEVIIAKHRNGPLGNVELYFNKDIQRYLTLDNKES